MASGRPVARLTPGHGGYRSPGRAWAYAERPEELLLRSGVMWRTIVVVPYGRLQYVDVEAGPLARALGIASVQLHTASAAPTPGSRG